MVGGGGGRWWSAGRDPSSWQGRGVPRWRAWARPEGAGPRPYPPTSTGPSYKASREEGLPLPRERPEMKTALLFLAALAVASGPGEGLAGGWGQWGAGPWKPGVAHF